MALKLTCPDCDSSFALTENVRGKKAFCPSCGSSLSVTGAGVAKSVNRSAPKQPGKRMSVNPIWFFIGIPGLLLAGGLGSYLIFHNHEKPLEVAKTNHNPPDEPNDRTRDAEHGHTDPPKQIAKIDLAHKEPDKHPDPPIVKQEIKSADNSNGKSKEEPAKTDSDTRMVGDAKVRTLKLPAKGILECMIWADAAGSAFLALDGDAGVLRRISFPDGKVVKQKQLDGKFSWMSLSAEGLLLSDPGSERILVVDPATLEAKTEIAVPKLKRAASAPGQSWAVACDQGPFQTQKLYVVNLLNKKVDPVAVSQDLVKLGGSTPPFQGNALGVDNPAVTPDGAYVFTQGDNPCAFPGPGEGEGRPIVPLGGTPALFRFSFKDGKLTYEESNAHHSQRDGFNKASVTISPDSKLVCLTWLTNGPGRSDVPSATTIYPVDTFKKQYCTLEQGVFQQSLVPQSVGFDIKGGFIYAQDRNHELVLFTPHGAKRKEYTLEHPDFSWPAIRNRLGVVIQDGGSRPWQEGDGAGNVQQYLVHPGGNRLVLLTRTAIHAIEVPKEK